MAVAAPDAGCEDFFSARLPDGFGVPPLVLELVVLLESEVEVEVELELELELGVEVVDADPGTAADVEDDSESDALVELGEPVLDVPVLELGVSVLVVLLEPDPVTELDSESDELEPELESDPVLVVEPELDDEPDELLDVGELEVGELLLVLDEELAPQDSVSDAIAPVIGSDSDEIGVPGATLTAKWKTLPSVRVTVIVHASAEAVGSAAIAVVSRTAAAMTSTAVTLFQPITAEILHQPRFCHALRSVCSCP